MILLNCHWFCQGDVGLDSSAPRPGGRVMSTIFKCMSVFLLILSRLWLLACLLILNYITETLLKVFHWKLTIFICIAKSILNGYPIHRFSRDRQICLLVSAEHLFWFLCAICPPPGPDILERLIKMELQIPLFIDCLGDNVTGQRTTNFEMWSII